MAWPLGSWQDAAAAVVALAVAVLFVVLLVQAAQVRMALTGIEKQQWAAPDELAHAPRLAQVVRSYAVRVDLDAGQRLGQARGARPVLHDQVRAVCAGGRDHTVPVVYARVWWLALWRDGGSDALYADVLSGAVRYAAVAGATVRIAAADEQQPQLAQLVAERLSEADQARVRVFVVAPAYEVREARPERPEHVRAAVARGACNFDVSLALPSDPARLLAWLEQAPPAGGEARAHVWGFGMGR